MVSRNGREETWIQTTPWPHSLKGNPWTLRACRFLHLRSSFLWGGLQDVNLAGNQSCLLETFSNLSKILF